jgi:hypothetical protein
MQKPRVHKEHLDWMCTQAEKEKTTLAGRNGYIMFDKMAIQIHDKVITLIDTIKI